MATAVYVADVASVMLQTIHSNEAVLPYLQLKKQDTPATEKLGDVAYTYLLVAIQEISLDIAAVSVVLVKMAGHYDVVVAVSREAPLEPTLHAVAIVVVKGTQSDASVLPL